MMVLNEYDRANLNAPSISADKNGLCAICHMRPASNRHHIVPRSHGGKNGATVAVCGNGNMSGCHRLLHAGCLHLMYKGGAWWYLQTKKPCKVEKAQEMSGWQKLAIDKREQVFGGR